MARTIVGALTAATVFAIAQPNVRRGDSSAQASALGALRAISSAQATYAAVNGGYARSLRALGAPCPAGARGFISPDLSNDSTMKAGYEIRLATTTSVANGRRDCNGEPVASSYYATAVPVERGGVTAAFAVDEDQIIWQDSTGVAPVPPFRETRTVTPLSETRTP
jgi:hypothetical protein